MLEQLDYSKSTLLVCKKHLAGLPYLKNFDLKAETYFPLTGKSNLCYYAKNFFLY